MRFFLVTTQKLGLKITKMKSSCKLNSLVVASGLQSPGPRIDTGSTRPRIPFATTKRKKREGGVRVWRWWFSLPSVCCFSVFLRRCCCLCLRASSSPAQIFPQRQQVRGPTLLPTSKIFIKSASLLGLWIVLFPVFVFVFGIFFENHLR